MHLFAGKRSGDVGIIYYAFKCIFKGLSAGIPRSDNVRLRIRGQDSKCQWCAWYSIGILHDEVIFVLPPLILETYLLVDESA